MKRSVLLSLLGVSAILLAGCTGSGTSTSTSGTSTSGTSSDNSTYSFTIKLGTPTAQKEFVMDAAQDYLTANGYTNVKLDWVEHNESDIDDMTDPTTFADIYAYASDQTLNLIQKGTIASVPESIATELQSELTDAAYQAGVVGEDLYGYPYAGDNGYFLYYNKEVVSDTQAQTVAGIVEACEAARVKFSYPLADSFYGIGNLFTYGARYTVTLNAAGDAISSVTADFNEENGLKAAKAQYDLLQNSTIDTTKTAKAAPLTSNNLGAVIDGSWSVADYTKAFTDAGKADKLGMAKMPALDDGTTLGSYLGYKLYAVNPQPAGTDTDRLAVEHALAHYLVSEDVQEARFDELTIAPTNKTVAAMDKVTGTPHIKALTDQSAYAVAQTIVPSTIWKAEEAFYTALTTVDSTGDVDSQIKAALDTFNAAVESAK